MFTVNLISQTDSAAAGFVSLLNVWVEQTSNLGGGMAEQYAQNLLGIRNSVGGSLPGVWFAEVWDDTGAVVAVAKLTYNAGRVEISEVVKYPGASSGAVRAVFACALDLCDGDNRPTLVAEKYALVAVYARYGFAIDEANVLIPKHLWGIIRPDKLPMKMTADGAVSLRAEFRKGVEWQHSLNWID